MAVRGLRLLILSLLVWAHQEALAQRTMQVLVVDSATAEPLIGAGLLVIGTGHAYSTDVDGRCTLQDLPDAPVHVKAVNTGYRTDTLLLPFPRPAEPFLIRMAATATELEEVTVSTTRTNSRIDDAPQKIEVLGEEELHEEGSLKPGNVASLIGDISSVQIQQTSASSGASTVRMQGLDGRYTLLLRDGMPAYGGLSGGFDLLRIPPLDLQRVELLKGPSSTFNGGGAIAGAINFVSKAPADSLGGLVLLNATSLHERNADVFVSGPLSKRVGFTLFGGSTFQEATDVDGDGYSDVPLARTYTVHPQVFLAPTSATQLRVGGLYQHDVRTGGDLLAVDAPQDTSRYFLRTVGERLGLDVQLDQTLSDRAKLVVKGSWNRYDQQDRTNLATEQRTQTNPYAEAYWSGHTARRTWVAGGSYSGSTLSGAGAAQDLGVAGVFGQLALHRARWPEIDLGFRADQPTDGTDPFLLPSIAAMYKLSRTVSLRANAGSGYQLPDLSRNYGLVTEGGGATRVGDGIRPERSLGGTVEWTWKKPLSEHTLLFVDQTFFATSITDPLAVVADGGVYTLVNPGGTTLTRGVDNYIRLTHGSTELYAGYTYTLPERTIQQVTSVVPYTPQHRAAMTLGREFGDHWRAGIEASWSGPQERIEGGTTRDQLFLAAMAGYQRGAWTIVLNGENLSDTRQTRWEPVVSGTLSRPVFAPLWAPIDGRAINLSVLYRF